MLPTSKNRIIQAGGKFHLYCHSKFIKFSLAGEDIILYIEWNPVQNEGDLPTEGRPVVVPSSGSPKVELKAIKDGEYVIGGVLTDVYQRKMTSEIVNVQ